MNEHWEEADKQEPPASSKPYEYRYFRYDMAQRAYIFRRPDDADYQIGAACLALLIGRDKRRDKRLSVSIHAHRLLWPQSRPPWEAGDKFRQFTLARIYSLVAEALCAGRCCVDLNCTRKDAAADLDTLIGKRSKSTIDRQHNSDNDHLKAAMFCVYIGHNPVTDKDSAIDFVIDNAAFNRFFVAMIAGDYRIINDIFDFAEYLRPLLISPPENPEKKDGRRRRKNPITMKRFWLSGRRVPSHEVLEQRLRKRKINAWWLASSEADDDIELADGGSSDQAIEGSNQQSVEAYRQAIEAYRQHAFRVSGVKPKKSPPGMIKQAIVDEQGLRVGETDLTFDMMKSLAELISWLQSQGLSGSTFDQDE